MKQAKTDLSEPGREARKSSTLELVRVPLSREAADSGGDDFVANSYAAVNEQPDTEREFRQLTRALIHATVFLARAPFLIEQASKAVEAKDEERLRIHARILRRCAWHVTRGSMVRQVEELDLAAGEADFHRAGLAIEKLAPEFSQLINRLSMLLSS